MGKRGRKNPAFIVLSAKGGCPSSKVRHENEEQAKWAARQGMLDGAPTLNVYWCILCTGWHLTSSLGRPAAKRKKMPALWPGYENVCC